MNRKDKIKKLEQQLGKSRQKNFKTSREQISSTIGHGQSDKTRDDC